jgi:predicted DNA-binding transcriptional regulator AlpA
MKLLRYPDLVAMGVINSRPTLARMIATQNFPPGQLISPNARAWEESEVIAWVRTRPQSRKEKNYDVRKKNRACRRPTGSLT